MTSLQKYNNRVESANSLVCVGLDSEISKIPAKFAKKKYPQFAFNKWIIEQTAEFTSAYKPNVAFYEARGAAGIEELQMTCKFLRASHPEILIIIDAKRADIGSTNEGYVSFFYDYLKVDGVTLHPYLGLEALQPFLDAPGKFSIILCHTSNPGAGEFQDLQLGKQPLWQTIAEHCVNNWHYKSDCALVMGATFPEQLSQIRSIVGDMPLLVPGVGAQGGSAEDVVKAGQNSKHAGLIINSSRGIIFAADPAMAVKKLRDEINGYRFL